MSVQLLGSGEGGGDGWSDSDEAMESGVEKGEGEYIRRWWTVRVPTKDGIDDPPSSEADSTSSRTSSTFWERWRARDAQNVARA